MGLYPYSCCSFISSSFCLSLLFLYFSWMRCISGWKTDILAVDFCCLMASGSSSTRTSTVKTIMVTA